MHGNAQEQQQEECSPGMFHGGDQHGGDFKYFWVSKERIKPSEMRDWAASPALLSTSSFPPSKKCHALFLKIVHIKFSLAGSQDPARLVWCHGAWFVLHRSGRAIV